METLKTIWDFFQNEVLGMNWLNRLIETFLNACGLDTTGKIGGSVQFFIYDTVKIMVLLGVLILIISYIQSYFPPERTKKILGRFHGIWANIIAALLGTVTPFCSCSSIPLFIGFTSAGLPLGVTFSFLISSPMVDLGSLVLLMSIFGWKVAVLYVIFGLVIAVAGGTLIEKLHLDNQVEEYIRNGHSIDVPQEELHFKDRMKFAWEQVVETAKKVAPYVLIGVGKGLLRGCQVQKGQLELNGAVEVVEEIAPALEDRCLVLVLRELIVDVLELDGLCVAAACHTADAVRPHPFIGDTVLSRFFLFVCAIGTGNGSLDLLSVGAGQLFHLFLINRLRGLFVFSEQPVQPAFDYREQCHTPPCRVFPAVPKRHRSCWSDTGAPWAG